MLGGLLLFLLFIVALLAIPLSLAFQVSRRDALKGSVELRWAFGLLRIRIPLEEGEGSSRQAPRRRQPLRFGSLGDSAFRLRMLRFVGDLWRAMHKQDIYLQLRLGLGDPADTGRLWAVVGPVAALLASSGEARVAVEPEFMDAVFEIDAGGAVRIIPLQIIYLVLALLLSPAVWRAIRQR